jgi:hypothetical protein
MAKPESVSEANISALAKTIKAAPQPHGFNAGQFCQLWKQVKPALETILPLARMIPGVGVIISGGHDLAACRQCGIVRTLWRSVALFHCWTAPVRG